MTDARQARPAIGGSQDVFRAKEFAPLPLFVRGAGVRLWDDEGKEYIDVSSGPVVSNIGHGNTKVIEAIAAQARTLDYLSSRQGRTRANIELSERIATLAGPGYERVCLSSGGSEANEIALKFLRQYAVATGEGSRTKIISCMPSYHGSTIATLGVSGDSGSRAFLDGFGAESIKIPAPLTYRLPNGTTAEQSAEQSAAELEKAILEAGPTNVLAFIIEPIGGLASGCVIPPKSFFRRIRDICDRHGVFLIFDEVLCGSGRTGAFLASRHVADVQADVVVLAKGLGAGYIPLGATLASSKMVDCLAELTGFSYMHTYSANPIACAAGLAVLQEMQDGDLMSAAVESGAYLHAGLNRLADQSRIVGDLRGAGLLLAVEIVADKTSKALFRPEQQALEHLRVCAAKNGLLIYARRTSVGKFGEWFMVSPPLTITRAECDELLSRLSATLRDLETVLLSASQMPENAMSNPQDNADGRQKITPAGTDRAVPVVSLPLRKPGSGFSLLRGVRILDLTTSIAGPYATLLLSDLGAEVVKIERLGIGDDARNWGPPFLDGKSLWHASVNRNKRSISLDYSGAPGKEVLRELVERCDALVTNQLPKVRAKLGTDYETLSDLNPALVYVSVTGFGTGGVRCSWPCYDIIAEGYSGVMEVTGTAESGPQKIGTPAGDLLAGQDAALSCVAALLDARATGRGHYIDISMVESMTRFLIPRTTVYLGSGEVPQRTGAKDSVVAIYQTFRTSDSMITLALNSNPVWNRFWEVSGDKDYGAHERFNDNAGRRKWRSEIVEKIQQLLLTKTKGEWLKLFNDSGVPAGPILTVKETTEDEELLDRGMFFAIDSGGSLIPQVGLGIRIDGKDAGFRSPPPELGQDTEIALASLLGYDETRLEELRRANAIPRR